MTKVSFFGAAGEVTGSNFLVDTGEHKYVVDCGLFQGGDQNMEHNTDPFGYNPAELDAVIVTHSHLDHIGRLPVLVKEGFRGPLYATEATIELTALVLKDALHIMTSNFERENKQTLEGEHQNSQARRPTMLYEQADLQRTLDQFRAVEYNQPTKLAGQDTVTFYDAGHILGSASVQLNAGGKNVVFSGDLGHFPNPLLPKPRSPLAADLIVTEATYGGVERQNNEDRLTVLKNAISWTLERRGVLLIPAFSIERTQELLYLLHHLFMEHQLPKVPVFVDSPLAIEALEVFQRHQELYAAQVQRERELTHELFNFRGLVLTPTGQESREINDLPPPKIIIAGSGMMDGGRISYHLKRYLSQPNTLLLVVGYQAEGTLGRTIVEGATSVFIAGDDIPVHAKVEVVDIFSGHADNSELLAWLQAIKLSSNGSIAIVHSDPKRAATYQAELQKQLPNHTITVAEIGQSIEV